MLMLISVLRCCLPCLPSSLQFQQAYTGVVLRLKEVNGKLEPMLEQLSGRARHVALLANAVPSNPGATGVSAAAAAAAAASLSELTSPLAAVPPGSAMAGGMLGEFQPEALGASALGGSAPAAGSSDGGAAPQGQAAGTSGQQGLDVLGESTVAATSIVPRGGGTAMSDAATVASAIVAAAMTDARNMVDQARGAGAAMPVRCMKWRCLACCRPRLAAGNMGRLAGYNLHR